MNAIAAVDYRQAQNLPVVYGRFHAPLSSPPANSKELHKVDKLKKLQAELAEVDGKLDALLAHDELTDEQQAEHDRLAGEHERIVKAIGNEKGRIARAAERESIALESMVLEATPAGRKSQADPPTKARVEVKPPEKFKGLGDQLQAIARAELSGRPDNRLQWDSFVPQAAVSGAGAGVPSDGGYLIEKDTVTELQSKMYATGEILPRVRKVSIGPNSDGLKINMIDESSRATGSRWGGVQVYWGAEADAATAKKPKFRQSSMELKDLIGLAYVTDRLLADATALESVFSQAFAEEMSFMVEDAVVNGTGAGMPLGIINSGCLVSVAKETGQAAATIVYENLLKMWSRMWAKSRANAIWIINQDIEPQLHGISMPVGTGGVPVFLPPGGLSATPYASLFGRPVVPTEYNATLGTTGDIMLIDPSQYILIEKGGMQAESSIHVKFTTNEKTFRFIYRTDGQPTWNSALTPFKGSATKSPFVKLDTRA